MKRFFKLSGLILIIVLTGNGCRNTERKIEERFDHFRMHRHDNAMEFRHMRRMGMIRDMDLGHWNKMKEGGRNMRPGEMGQGFMRLQRIRNLTDDQRKAISDLRLKQMEEMDKFHEETFAKLESIREAHRKALMNILTGDQRKILESDSCLTESGTSSTPK
jgi:hypothetical protein